MEEAMQIYGPSSSPEEPTTTGMPEGDRLLPPKKRPGLTAPEGALEALKKAKVDADSDADSDTDSEADARLIRITEEWNAAWQKSWNEYIADRNAEDQTVEDDSGLPEDVECTCLGSHGNYYQKLVVYDGYYLHKDKYVGDMYDLKNEEQRAYLKFYYQLCKEVKLGAKQDECAEKANSLGGGGVSESLIELAIEDRMEALDAELKVNIRDSMYCYLWDEFILKKRDYASVVAEIGEKYPKIGEEYPTFWEHYYFIKEDVTGRSVAKSFLKEIEERIGVSMPSEEAHEQVKKACAEQWPVKYVTFASFLELKMMFAKSRGFLPKELEGLLEELHLGSEN